MKSIFIIIFVFIISALSYGQQLHLAESFELSAQVTGSHIYEASQFIKMLPGFQYTPATSEEFVGRINPYLVVPPIAGETGGPGGEVGSDGVVGATAGELNVSEIGAATYMIPIKCITGIAGMQPSLSLIYNSMGSDGMLGPGWSLQGISEIQKIIDKSNTAGNLEEFTDFALDGNRLIFQQILEQDPGNPYIVIRRLLKKEDDDFSKIIFVTPQGNKEQSYFEVFTKSGLKYVYGNNNNSRRTFNDYQIPISYMISSIEDLFGNTILFEYQKDESIGECIPSTIKYTVNQRMGITLPDYCIQFIYESRPDRIVHRTWAQPNVTIPIETSVAHLLTDINILSNSIQVKNYHIDYQIREEGLGIDFQKKFLYSVQETGMEGEKYNKTIFHLEDEPTCSNYQTIEKTLSEDDVDYYIDLNAEGNDELVVFNATNKYIKIFEILENNNSYSFSSEHYADVRDNLSFGDFNGDGKNDIIQWYSTNDNRVKFDLWLSSSTYNTFSFIKNYSVLDFYIDDNMALQPYVGDYNGDGISDILIRIFNGTYNTSSCSFYFGTPSGDFIYKNPSTTPNEAYLDFNIDIDFKLYQGDFNGDGRSDFLCYRKTGDLLAENKLLLIIPNLSLLPELQTNLPYYYSEVIADFNGDFKSDLLYISYNVVANRIVGYNCKIFQSTGKKFIETGTSSFNLQYPAEDGFDRIHFSTGELNLDGHPDLIANISLYRNYGNITEPYEIIQPIVSNCTGDKLVEYDLAFSPPIYYNNEFKLQDINGDAKSDLIMTFSDYSDAKHLSLIIYPHDGNKIINITNGIGSSIEIDYMYLTSNRYFTESENWPTKLCNLPLPLVKNVKSDNGFGEYDIMNYSYSNPRLHPKRGFLGFLQTSKNDPIRNITVTSQNTLLEFQNAITFRNDYYNKRFFIVPETVIQKNGAFPNSKLFTETNYSFDLKLLNSSTTSYLYLKEQTDKIYELDGSLVKVTQTNNDNLDEYGNIQLISFKQGTTVTSLPYEESTVNVYENWTSGDTWILGRLMNTTVTKKSPGRPDIVRNSSFTYYSTHGQLESETIEPNDPKALTKTYTYDDFGNIETTVISPGTAQRSTTTEYDHNLTERHGRFLTKMTNAKGQVSSKTIDPITGLTIKTTDLNGLDTKSFYDGFGSTFRVINPDQTQAVSVARWCSANDADKPEYAVYYTWAKSTASSPVVKYYSLIGKELRTVTIGFEGRKIYNDVEYDGQGRVWKTYQPYFADSPPVNKTFTKTEYDLFNRINVVIQPDLTHQTLYTYEGLKTTVTNPLGQSSSKVLNAAGWLIKSTDGAGKSVINEYNSDGSLFKKYLENQPLTTITFALYDAFGHALEMDDPDLGTITYSYNVFGELESEKNNRDITTIYTYDELGRIETRVETNNTTTWVYDETENGIGLLSSVSGTEGHAISYQYDDLSRNNEVDETIDGTTYITKTQYDEMGRTKEIIYPSTQYSVTHNYNEYGYLSEIHQTSDNKLLWKADSYNEKGQLLQSTLGNNLTTIKEYNPLDGSLTGIQTGNIQHFDYKFDAIGNLEWRKDVFRNLKESFEYDNINRLRFTYLNDALTPSKEVRYDQAGFGNIVYKSDVGNYTYSATQPHKLLEIDNRPPIISAYEQNIEYTDFDKVEKITLNDNNDPALRSTLNLTYGIDRQRIKQVIAKNGTTTTRIYVGGLYEKYIENGVTQEIHYISGGEGLIAIYTKKDNEASLNYILKDHLGSIQLSVREDGTVESEFSYDAWGLPRNPVTWVPITGVASSAMDRGFTGHEHLGLFDLIDMNGRIYDPAIGYFTSPDPVLQFGELAQGLNRYSYCLNNPLSMIDPSGHNAWNIIIPIASIAAAITVTAITGGFAAPSLFSIMLSGAAGGFTGSLLSSIASGCTFTEGFCNVFFGTITGTLLAVTSFGIGTAFSGVKNVLLKVAGQSTAHALKGGLFSMAQGGKFEQGFMAGGFSSFSGLITSGFDDGVSRVIAGAIVGGTAEEIGGGKFANGAVTGAFTVMYNDVMHTFTLKGNPPIKIIDETDPDDPKAIIKCSSRQSMIAKMEELKICRDVEIGAIEISKASGVEYYILPTIVDGIYNNDRGNTYFLASIYPMDLRNDRVIANYHTHFISNCPSDDDTWAARQTGYPNYVVGPTEITFVKPAPVMKPMIHTPCDSGIFISNKIDWLNGMFTGINH